MRVSSCGLQKNRVNLDCQVIARFSSPERKEIRWSNRYLSNSRPYVNSLCLPLDREGQYCSANGAVRRGSVPSPVDGEDGVGVSIRTAEMPGFSPHPNRPPPGGKGNYTIAVASPLRLEWCHSRCSNAHEQPKACPQNRSHRGIMTDGRGDSALRRGVIAVRVRKEGWPWVSI
jgi:hypothetical protein